MKLLREMYDQPGLDNYDRAIDMINAAVEKHADNFQEIADVESLVGYLKGVHHDFSEQLEQTVRDIIADETGAEEKRQPRTIEHPEDMHANRFNPYWDTPDEEEEEFRGGGKYNRDTAPDFKGPGKQPTYFAGRVNKKYQGTLKKASRMIPAKKEEEELNDFLTPAGRKRLADTNWDEEVSKFRKRRPKDDYGRASGRMMKRRRATHSRSPFDVSIEQEETFSERTKRYKRESDKIIDDNRKRKMARKYGISGPSSRRRRFSRRKGYENPNLFSVRFESFVNEMYRDSQHGLTIDLSGPEGNAFYLIGQAKRLAKDLGKNGKEIAEEMMSGDYENVLNVFEREFGNVVTLVNR